MLLKFKSDTFNTHTHKHKPQIFKLHSKWEIWCKTKGANPSFWGKLRYVFNHCISKEVSGTCYYIRVYHNFTRFHCVQLLQNLIYFIIKSYSLKSCNKKWCCKQDRMKYFSIQRPSNLAEDYSDFTEFILFWCAKVLYRCSRPLLEGVTPNWEVTGYFWQWKCIQRKSNPTAHIFILKDDECSWKMCSSHV